LLVTPSKLFISGILLQYIPLFFTDSRIFEYIHHDEYFLLVSLYTSTIIPFYFGSLMVNHRIERQTRFILIPRNNNVIFFIILIFAIFLLYIVFGSIPIYSLLLGLQNIGEINDQNSQAGGLMGVSLILTLFLIMVSPLLSFKNKLSSGMFYILLFLVMIFTAKRQLIFIFLFTYILASSRLKLTFQHLSLFFLGIMLFLYIGWLRVGTDALEHLLFYISFPIINTADLITNDMIFFFSFDFIDLSLPSIFRSTEMTASSYGYVFPSAGLGGFGKLIIYSGLFGMWLYIGIVSILVHYMYYRAKRNDFYLILYSFSAWPLFTLPFYPRFNNFLFYILPVVLFCIYYSFRSSQKRDSF